MRNMRGRNVYDRIDDPGVLINAAIEEFTRGYFWANFIRSLDVCFAKKKNLGINRISPRSATSNGK